MQSRKSLLFSDGEPWVKKDEENDFDVPMGCYDGAELCQLAKPTEGSHCKRKHGTL